MAGIAASSAWQRGTPGHTWTVLPVALLAAAVLLPLAAMLHTLADTGLRMWPRFAAAQPAGGDWLA
jgi:uncharacterized membrane protein YhaH (DUF805 family)